MGTCHMCPTSPSFDLTLSIEENALVNCEQSLLYHRSPVSKLAEVLTANSNNRKLTENQFNTVVTDLRLNVQDLDTVGSPMFNFYKGCRVKGYYDLSKLLVVATLLGSGSTEDRVAVLFDLLPALEGGMATALSLDWLVDQVFLVAAKSLPQLVQADDPVRGVSLSPDQVTAYMTRLADNLPLAKPAAVRLLLKEQQRLSRQDLVRGLEGPGVLGKFLRPLEARVFFLRDEFRSK